ncbi:MAG TPA: gephyrin-like molybdotransferase Glp [Chloroflexota bacterium]|nr:gephyrin-like molybdotransferase Glp [Chloroflexota bacterium]
MISVDAALATILDRFSPLPAEERPILETLGQVLAEDVRAGFDVPPLTNAAMDGYAVRAADTAGAGDATPVRLRVVEDLPAGRCATHAVEPGSAIRIMTGAPLPPGADAVVQFELTGEGRGRPRGESVEIFAPARPATNIRLAGEDLRRGAVVLASGTPIRPAEIGVLATMGRRCAPVHRRPRVAILSTGDELLQPGQPWSAGKIYDANSFTLAAMVQRFGGVPVMLGAAPDRLDELVARVDRLSGAVSSPGGAVSSTGGVDLLVTSAGVSAGDYDVVKQALTSVGEVAFYQVRMRPGRPLAFGQLRGVPLLGLPGNPVASAISFELFGRPAIFKMLGWRGWARPEVVARFEGSVDNRDLRRSFYRVRLSRRDGELVARLTGPQGSGILTSLAQADGLMVVEEETRTVGSGDRVRVWLLE